MQESEIFALIANQRRAWMVQLMAQFFRDCVIRRIQKE